MKQKSILLFALVAISPLGHLFGQIKSKVIITIKEKEAKILDADVANIPFDEEFILQIKDFKLGTTGLKVSYGIRGYTAKSKYKSWKHYFITKSDLIDKKAVLNDDGTFLFNKKEVNDYPVSFNPFPALHPNEKYYINLESIGPFKLSDSDIRSLSGEIGQEINKTYKNAYPLDEDLESLREKIGQSIKKRIGDKIIFIDEDATKKLGNLDLLNDLPKIKTYINEYGTKIQEIGNAYLNVLKTSPVDALGYNFLKKIYLKREKIILAFENFVRESATPGKKSELIDSKTSSNFYYQDLYKILIEDYHQDSEWESLNINKTEITSLEDILGGKLFGAITGRFKILDKDFQFSNSYLDKSFDVETLKLLKKGFDNLIDVKDLEGNNIVHLKDIQEISSYLTKIIVVAKEINDLQEIIKLSEVKPELGNILEKTFTSWTNVIDISTTVVIDKKETPYIGLDLGYLFAPTIESHFIAQSVNFHLVPVNRNTKIRDYKGWRHKVLKNASISFGIAQRIGNYNDDRYEKLTTLGSPFIGLGWRFSRVVRFNGGVLFYEEKSSNPIVKDNVSKGAPFISINIDFKLKDALGLIGTLFKSP